MSSEVIQRGKKGPKGPWKVKGQVLEALVAEDERDPAQPSWRLAQRVHKLTGVRVAPRTVRRYRRRLKRGN